VGNAGRDKTFGLVLYEPVSCEQDGRAGEVRLMIPGISAR
jgi:hypothetical protein